MGVLGGNGGGQIGVRAVRRPDGSIGVLSSEGDTSCCCDDDGGGVRCWLQILPCGCDDIRLTKFVEAGVTALYPPQFDVLRFEPPDPDGAKCWRIVSRFRGRVPDDVVAAVDSVNGDLDLGRFVTMESSCDAPECGEFDCPDLPCPDGTRQFNGTLLSFGENTGAVVCAARAVFAFRLTMSASATMRFQLPVEEPATGDPNPVTSGTDRETRSASLNFSGTVDYSTGQALVDIRWNHTDSRFHSRFNRDTGDEIVVVNCTGQTSGVFTGAADDPGFPDSNADDDPSFGTQSCFIVRNTFLTGGIVGSTGLGGYIPPGKALIGPSGDFGLSNYEITCGISQAFFNNATQYSNTNTVEEIGESSGELIRRCNGTERGRISERGSGVLNQNYTSTLAVSAFESITQNVIDQNIFAGEWRYSTDKSGTGSSRATRTIVFLPPEIEGVEVVDECPDTVSLPRSCGDEGPRLVVDRADLGLDQDTPPNFLLVLDPETGEEVALDASQPLLTDGDPVAVVGQFQECPPAQTHPEMRPCDGGDPIAADDEDRQGRENAYFNGILYITTGNQIEGDPVAVDWTDDQCPQGPELWERCADPDNPFAQPGTNPDPPIPPRVREFRGGDATHLVAVFTGEVDNPGGVGSTPPRCDYSAAVYYRKIDDDGSDAPEVFSGSTASGCEQDRFTVLCGGDGGVDPQEPVDPGEPTPEDPAATDDDTGLGNLIAEAIRITSAGTVRPCAGCEKRKRLINRFGNQTGRALARKLREMGLLDRSDETPYDG